MVAAVSAGALVVLGSAPSPVVAVAANGLTVADYRRIVDDEAYWVSTAQLTCTGDGRGAIAEARVQGPGRVSIHPYEANLSARGMLAAGSRYFPMVKNYLRWYLAHLNRPDVNGVTGTVYDWDYDPTTCIGAHQRHPLTGAVPKYDSTDAYAGTFLSLVADYARRNPADHAYLRTRKVRADLESVADVVAATRGASGLSAATPTYHAEFLLDNVEAARGLDDYAWLLGSALGEPERSARRAREAADVHAAIETRLWTGSRTPGMYGWAADQLEPSWTTWYPDSLAQAWPVWDRLGSPERRSALWTGLTAAWPRWAASTPSYGSGAIEHDPNAGIAYAAARVGDKAALDDYLVRSEANWIATGRPPPWTVDDSGLRGLAALGGMSLPGA